MLELAEERTSGLEARLIEIMQSIKQRENRMNLKKRASEKCRTPLSILTYV